MHNYRFEQRIGVCSWSLQPEGPKDLVEKIERTGIRKVQLALNPVAHDRAWSKVDGLLSRAGISVVSGMFGTKDEDYTSLETIRATGGILPDETWEHNWRHIQKIIEAARKMEVELISFHAGFLPEKPEDPLYVKIKDRLRRIADAFAEVKMDLAFETGQEEAETLKRFLVDLDAGNVGVNFDPANMILYGKGDPVAAVKTLGSHIRQVHVKDAIPTKVPGTWGEEKAAGEGAVDWPAFFAALENVGFKGNLCIEREAGNERIEDIRKAKDLILNA